MLKNVLRYRRTVANAALGFAFLGMITAAMLIDYLREDRTKK
jgi:hypothetical protein